MKNGFTLIELLIVMVIISALVTIALPKYQRALERGRALEGVRNVQYIAEYVAAKCMTDGPCPSKKEDIELFTKTDIVKSRFFDFDTLVINGSSVTISRKEDSGWDYSLTATTNEGSLSSITCNNTGTEDVCTELNLSGNLVSQ